MPSKSNSRSYGPAPGCPPSPLLADVRLRRLRVTELPLERRRPGADRVGVPDRVIDALLAVAVDPDAHPLGGLALVDQLAVHSGIEVIGDLRPGLALDEVRRRAAEVDVGEVVVLVHELAMIDRRLHGDLHGHAVTLELRVRVDVDPAAAVRACLERSD